MEIKLGDVLQHKATGKRCVIIKILKEDKVGVRDANNEYNEYYKYELEPEPGAPNMSTR